MEAGKDEFGRSKAAEGGRRGDEFIVYELYSPCHYLRLLMKALLRCLCSFCSPAPRREKAPETEEEEEEEEDHRERTWRRSGGQWRWPARPPIGTGGGGQTN